MKKLIFFSVLFLTYLVISAQDITIFFQPKVSGTTIDSIWVTNQRTNEKVKLLGNETLSLTKVTGVNSLPLPEENGLVFPNPCISSTELSFSTFLNQQVEIRVYNISGQLLSNESLFLLSGRHTFDVTFPQAGIYGLEILKNNSALSFKAICLQTNSSNCYIRYTATENYNPAKNAMAGKTLGYTQGDIFQCSVFSGKNNTIIADSPMASKVYSVEFYECIDSDNQSYPIVKIGNQWWMAKNLQTIKYNNGTAIPNVTYGTTWANLTTGAYCWYSNNAPSYQATYGALYNWYALNTGKLCPSGWHVPSDAEWKALATFLGGENVAGGKMKEAGTIHWLIINTGATNSSGFSALPGGYRSSSGSFYTIGWYGVWWSSKEDPTFGSGWGWTLGYDVTNIRTYYDAKEGGLSIRCLKD